MSAHRRPDRPAGAVVRPLPVAATSDAELAREAARGQPGAAACMWERYSVLIRGFLRRSLGPGEAVDDLVQETFVRGFEAVKRLEDPDKLRSFLVGIAVRVAREHLRRKRRWRLFGWPIEDAERAGVTDYDAAEALARLYRLLGRLDADTRLVFVLRYVEEIPTAEIAEVLGVSFATAKRRVKRAAERVERLAAGDPALARYVVADGEPTHAAPTRIGGDHG